MKKHIRIKAASCLDMIHAINSKIGELDPNYVGGSEVINASEDGNSPAYYWMVKYTDVMKKVHKIAFPLDTSDFNEAEQEMDAHIREPYTKAILLGKLEGHLKDQLLSDGFKIVASCNNSCNDTDCKQTITAEDDITDTSVDEDYIDEMMQYIADETVSLDPPATCSWRVEGENLIFVVAGIETDNVDEYTCPLADLTGEMEADVAYIAMAINAGDESTEIENGTVELATNINASTNDTLDSVIRNMFEECTDNAESEEYSFNEFVEVVFEHVMYAHDDPNGWAFDELHEIPENVIRSRVEELCNNWKSEGPDYAIDRNIEGACNTKDCNIEGASGISDHQAKIQAVLQKLRDEGYDVDSPSVHPLAYDYADTAAQLMASVGDVDEWFEDTLKNYPEDLEQFCNE